MTNIVEELRRKVKVPNPTKSAKYIFTLEWQAADEIERLRAENERLKDVLQNLLDHQNGPPLGGRFGEGWALAVDQARAALGKTEGEQG